MCCGSLRAVRERLFGTDGVRGLAGTELTEDLARGLGRAAVTVLGRSGGTRPSFVVGRDTRDSGEWLEDALVEGIREAGGNVFIAGVEPTPAIAFLATNAGAAVHGEREALREFGGGVRSLRAGSLDHRRLRRAQNVPPKVNCRRSISSWSSLLIGKA